MRPNAGGIGGPQPTVVGSIGDPRAYDHAMNAMSGMSSAAPLQSVNFAIGQAHEAREIAAETRSSPVASLSVSAKGDGYGSSGSMARGVAVERASSYPTASHSTGVQLSSGPRDDRASSNSGGSHSYASGNARSGGLSVSGTSKSTGGGDPRSTDRSISNMSGMSSTSGSSVSSGASDNHHPGAGSIRGTSSSSRSRSPGPSSKSGGIGHAPVMLDLSGKGLSVDTLDTSRQFLDLDGDGYQTRTAWAGAGTGVLVLDADGDGKIGRSSEFVFTEWDASAGGDLEALRRVFDTNNNNLLDAGDARWADFKVWVHGALVTLASQGLASIGLIGKGSGQNFADGSAITGTATFTRTNGTTGTVGDAVLASDEDSYTVKTLSVTNADGTKTVTVTGNDKDGSLAFREVATTSADGTSVTVEFDDDGDGTIDRTQGDVATLVSGVSKRTVSNLNADGSLKDRTITTTSADKRTVTTEVDQDGDAKIDQSQIYQGNADGSSTTTVTQFSVSGKVLKRVATSGSADGLTKTVSTDADGNGTYERVHKETTVVGSDGSRTKTVDETGGSGVLLASTRTWASADRKTIGASRRLDRRIRRFGRAHGRGAVVTRPAQAAKKIVKMQPIL